MQQSCRARKTNTLLWYKCVMDSYRRGGRTAWGAQSPIDGIDDAEAEARFTAELIAKLMQMHSYP